MRISCVSHAVFAATLIAIGIMGLISGDFGAIWQPVPKTLPARELLIYLCAFIAMGCGTALLFRRSAAIAARVLLATLVIWMLAFKVPPILRHPAVEITYQNWGETAVIVAAAWALYAAFATDWDTRRLGFATGARGVRIATVLYGLAMMAFGLSHLVYLKETAEGVPGWLPWHVAWAYLTGSTYLAAGVAVLINIAARVAAALSTLQMGLFTLLVWVPLMVAGPDAFQLSEFVISWALTAGAWVVTDSYRAPPRLV